MYQYLREVSGSVLAFRISGELTDKETDQIIGIVQKKIAEYGKIRLFVIIDHYPSLNSPESLYDDLKFAKLYADHITRMAVVGDRRWKKTWIALFGLFGGIQAEYFDRADWEEAWKWVHATTDRQS